MGDWKQKQRQVILPGEDLDCTVRVKSGGSLPARHGETLQRKQPKTEKTEKTGDF